MKFHIIKKMNKNKTKIGMERYYFMVNIHNIVMLK